MTEASPRVLGDHYVLTTRVAAAIDHEVWRATDRRTGRPCAVKIFTGSGTSDPSWPESFARDAERLEGLSHPGLAAAYAHGLIGDDPSHRWLAMAWIDGQEFSLLAKATAVPDQLDVIGQVAFALSGAHAGGVAHGAISLDDVLVHDGVATLVGFAPGAGAGLDEDLESLRQLGIDALVVDSDAPAELRRFVAWLSAPGDVRTDDAAEIGRVSLALAATLRAGDAATVVPVSAPGPAPDEASSRPDRERRRMRNRLILVGAIAVIGGGLLLRFVGEGGGQVTVPSVVHLPATAAARQLTTAGLKTHEQLLDGAVAAASGTVQSQSPHAGERVRAGSTVTITISGSGS